MLQIYVGFTSMRSCNFVATASYLGGIGHAMKVTRELGSAPVCDSYSPTYSLSHKEKRAIKCTRELRTG